MLQWRLARGSLGDGKAREETAKLGKRIQYFVEVLSLQQRYFIINGDVVPMVRNVYPWNGQLGRCLCSHIGLEEVGPLSVELIADAFTVFVIAILAAVRSLHFLVLGVPRIECVVVDVAIVKLGLSWSSSHQAVVNSCC